MYKLCFFVPESHLEKVKSALFAAGAGKMGNYENCSWQSAGQGQFTPLPGSSPFAGETGKTERLSEYKVEMVCADEFIASAVAALRKAHPYEEPAFDVWALAEF
ncbi:MAG: YqfO family protein [Spirochaetia bacterium]|jgi:hypothetical protein|nr:YqfO family protein [Spirochaetia bacterium]